MLKLNPMLKSDFYKQSHIHQYPKGTTLVCSNLTARGTRVNGLTGVIHFGTQASIQMLVEDFEENFFKQPKDEVLESFARRINTSLGGDVDKSHVEALHDLGYLPLTFWALDEGIEVPLRVPMVQFWNTDPRFYWLTNFIETEFSANTWGFITSATTANIYRKKCDEYALLTCDNSDHVKFQCHDFSYRGTSALTSGVLPLPPTLKFPMLITFIPKSNSLLKTKRR